MNGKQTYSDLLVASLLEQYRTTGDQRSRDAVVEQMRPLVTHVAQKFAGREPLEDLISEGFVGLIRAVDRYVPGRGARFSTFATHLISGQIRHYLRDRGHLIRQPAWLQELDGRVRRVEQRLEQELQRSPTVQEIAEASNLTEEGVEELLAAREAAKIVRMESAHDSEDEDYFLDVDPEKFRSREYVTLQLPLEDRIAVEAAMEKLKTLEQKVLYYFFFQDWNQSEIARSLGISCNYAGYLLRNGLKHMRERLPEQRATMNGDFVAMEVEQTVVDSETGVYNRTHFEQRLWEEMSRAQRFGQCVSVCSIRLPESASREQLQCAANVLKQKTRRADIVARIGESEFAVIFPNTGTVATNVAVRLAEQLHNAMGETIHTSAATFPDAGRTVGELLQAARETGSPELVEAINSVESRGLKAAAALA